MGFVKHRTFQGFDKLSYSDLSVDSITPELITCFETHGFIGLKYEELRKTKLINPELESSNIQNLRTKTFLWAAVAIVRLEILRELLIEANNRNISMLLFKGAALGYQIYNSPTERPCCDIDIFIDENQRNDVIKLLLSMGYKVDLVQETSMLCYQFSASKESESGHVVVLDIHYRINNQAEYEGLFQFSNVLSKSVNIPDIHPYAKGLCLADAFVLACVHLQGHYALGEPVKGIWVYDIHLLIQAMTVSDQENVVKYSENTSVWRICAYWTQVAQVHFDTKLPIKLQQKLFDTEKQETDPIQNNVNPVKLLWDQFYYLSNNKNRLRFLKELFLPPRQSIRDKYPNSKLIMPILYIRRAFNGLIKRISKVAR